MTNLSISPQTVQALKAGGLPLLDPRDGYLCVCGHTSLDHYDNGPLEDPTSIKHCALCMCHFLEESDKAQHLVPLLAKPGCNTCGGSGRVEDKWFSDGDGTMPCPDCSDGVPLGQVQLVVGCLRHWGAVKTSCHTCDHDDEPVATGELVQLLPIGTIVGGVLVPCEHLEFDAEAGSLRHVYKAADGIWRYTDLSHLASLAPWAESQWVGIITGLEMVK